MKTSISEEMVVSSEKSDPMYDDCFTVYPPCLTKQELEETVVFERLRLYNRSKPCGAEFLRQHLRYMGVVQLPSVSTIKRILSKHCLTHNRTGYYPEDNC